mmetsp:Transcript_6669/g.20808  ORF Transcript_6669/g.20808 Transcript_6669/m.20808 type:complete len:181 (-) Transcript_6669:211-753(-)
MESSPSRTQTSLLTGHPASMLAALAGSQRHHSERRGPPSYSPTPSQPQQPAREERPTYVNPKQYQRIIKRRQARAKLETLCKVTSERKNYLHESRHKHACRRKRGPGGRFLTKAELEALKHQEDAAAVVSVEDDKEEQLAADAIIAVSHSVPTKPFVDDDHIGGPVVAVPQEPHSGGLSA